MSEGSLRSIAPDRLIPVVVVDSGDQGARLGDALRTGGLKCAEVTLRTPGALDAIRAMSENTDFLVGAGTVLDVQQAIAAVRAGARFLVSPGLSREVAEWCRAESIQYVPGVATPTEIMTALSLSLHDLKVFPAGVVGGVALIKAMSGPFPQVNFMPTGGVDPNNLDTYLGLSNVAAIGGTWLAPADAIREGRFDSIVRLVSDARERVHNFDQ